MATMIVFFKVLKFSHDCFETDMYFYVFLNFFYNVQYTALSIKCVCKQHFQIRLARRKAVLRNSSGLLEYDLNTCKMFRQLKFYSHC